MSSPIMSLTQTSLHLHQHSHAKASLDELKLALICLSHIMHRTVTDICGSLSTASDVGGRQAPAGFSDLRHKHVDSAALIKLQERSLCVASPGFSVRKKQVWRKSLSLFL